jgi:hypothetical protein
VALRVVGEAAVVEDAWARRVADEAWAQTLRTNPRAHDGALLTLDGLEWSDGGGVTLRARRDAYRHFAVDDAVRAARGHAPATATPGVRETPVTCVGVSGVIVARAGAAAAAAGEPAFRAHPRVLMGRRGEGTRIYGGQWETAPRGTVSPPSEPSPGGDGAPPVLGADALERQLLEELIEETALPLGPAVGLQPVALVHDALARSVDVVYLIEARDDGGAGSAEWRAMLDDAASATGWEYPALRWRTWGFWRPDGETMPLSPPTAAFFGAADAWGLVGAD